MAAATVMRLVAVLLVVSGSSTKRYSACGVQNRLTRHACKHTFLGRDSAFTTARRHNRTSPSTHVNGGNAFACALLLSFSVFDFAYISIHLPTRIAAVHPAPHGAQRVAAAKKGSGSMPLNHQQALVATTGMEDSNGALAALQEFKMGIANVASVPLFRTWVGDNVCDWEGVSCDRQGTVTDLDLSVRSIQLEGRISPALGKLSGLTSIDLEGNDLCGAVPTELLAIESLRSIRFRGNTKLCGMQQFDQRLGFAVDYPNIFKPCNWECPTADTWMPKQSAADQAILLDEFKQGIVTAASTVMAEWQGLDPCEWPGVSCWETGSNFGKVQAIELPDSGLVGTISRSLTEITTLESVHLERNHLCGAVPQFSATLREMELFDNAGLCGGTPDFLPMSNAQGLSLDQECSEDCPPKFECMAGTYLSVDTVVCAACQECLDGQYLDGCGVANPGRCTHCSACDKGSFRANCTGNDAGTCVKCAACGADEYRVDGCHGAADAVCERCGECPKGEFRAGCGGEDQGRCVKCGQCPEGQRRVGCSATNPGTCVACFGECPADQFRESCDGECAVCEGCAAGEYRRACGHFSAGSCETCGSCGDGSFRADCGGSSAGECQICKNCSPGKFLQGCEGANPGECRACTECETGTYLKGCEGRSPGECRACLSCAEGLYRVDCEGTNPGTCAVCPSCPYGQYRSGCEGGNQGSCSVCEECPSGQYRVGCAGNDGGKCDFCPACPAGHRRVGCRGSFEGQCVACGAGQYESNGRCHDCPAGHSSEEGATQCVPCPAGTYASVLSGTCIPCPAGQFTSEAAMVQCAACPRGYKNAIVGSSSCERCPPGQGWTSSTSCERCPAGTASANGECSTCPPGTYSDVGAIDCTPCESGVFADAAGTQFSCITCPVGEAAVNKDSCIAVACPDHSYLAGAGKCICKHGYEGQIFWDPESFSYTGSCAPCPSNTWSSGNGQCQLVRCPANSASRGDGRCACEDGFTGSVWWQTNRYTGVCSEDGCPAGAVRVDDLTGEQPFLCECREGFEGSPKPDLGGISGTCRRCPRGYASEQGGPCVAVLCPGSDDTVARTRNLTGSHPACNCAAGAVGEIEWDFSTQSYTGKCVACPVGTWAPAGGSACEAVHCPANAGGYPDCACTVGYEGSVEWNARRGRWSGKCTACRRGSWNPGNDDDETDGSVAASEAIDIADSRSGDSAAKCSLTVPCPANSTFSKHRGGSCVCDATFTGEVTWEPETGRWTGVCTRCEEGQTSTAGGSCAPATCPAHGVARAGCSCAPGYGGNVIWDEEKWTWSGSCKRCHAGEVKAYVGNGKCAKCDQGMHSPPGAQTCDVYRCPTHAVGWPECKCGPGYAGLVNWIDGEYRGECEPCPTGYRTAFNGTACVKVECPDPASRHPTCACPVGTEGTVTWDPHAGVYQGECTRVPCPANALGWPSCRCDVGSSGNIQWANDAQDYTGACEECPEGSMQDEVGRASCKACGPGLFADSNVSCTHMPCPANASGHPACACDSGYMGKLVWDKVAGRFQGSCVACPTGHWSAPGSTECERVPCPVGTVVGAAEGSGGNCRCENLGEIVWNSDLGVYEGTCNDAGCPLNSVGFPRCQCAAGFYGDLEFDTNEQAWGGECLPCPPGKWSTQGDAVCEDTGFDSLVNSLPVLPGADGAAARQAVDRWADVVAKEVLGVGDELSNGERTAGCPDGYSGFVTFAYGGWSGQCAPCPHGFASPAGERECKPAPCPTNASGSPDCRCVDGFDASDKGHVTFDKNERVWRGGCSSCPPGSHSSASAGGPCAPVPCPANARRNLETGLCTCEEGAEGNLIWEARRGAYLGYCQPCGLGYTSSQPAADGSTTCSEHIACPALATNHPRCACKPMTFAKEAIEWNVTTRTYDGSCERCPIGTFAPLGAAACIERRCPPNSDGWPACACEAGFHGVITFDARGGTYLGACSVCPAGSFSSGNATTTCQSAAKGFWTDGVGATKSTAVECPENAEGHPDCACKAGYGGQLAWHGGQWVGECKKCAHGFWSPAGDGVCVKAACPRGATGHPYCACATGSSSEPAGVLAWNEETGVFDGQCKPCPVGSWAESGESHCAKVSCPPGSEGWPNCRCIHGHAGAVKWESETGLFKGSCFKCPRGSRPEGKTCVSTPCPAGSAGHPDCECQVGRHGTISFDELALSYAGKCEACPPGKTTSREGIDECDVNVPCPAMSNISASGTTCSCHHGFAGNIAWVDRLSAWVGTCADERCPPSASGFPSCHCNPGYEEAEPLMFFEDDQSWRGECRACPLGSAPSADGGCETVACPAGAAGHPYCACSDGLAGELTWTGTEYKGLCSKCEAGTVPDADSARCVALACPPNSVLKKAAVGGAPEGGGMGRRCVCTRGFEGSVKFNGAEFVGGCRACATGYMSIDGGPCKPATCPANAVGFPDCRCSEGFSGTLVWRPANGTYAGTCKPCPAGFTSPVSDTECAPVACPEHAVSHPLCVCDEPRYAATGGISLMWVPDKRTYAGSCVECGEGSWSPDGLRCVEHGCPVHSSGAQGECTCDPGYTGELTWKDDDVVGTCEPCGEGYTTADGGACFEVPCPSDAAGHPACACEPGFEGKVEWDKVSLRYVGACQKCMDGWWTAEGGGPCEEVLCPKNSVPLAGGGCECATNFHGNLTLVEGSYRGSCMPCGKGYRGSFDGECEKVDCPAFAVGWPHCSCGPGYAGDIVWAHSMGRYLSECLKKPVRVPRPSFSPSASVSPTPAPSTSPSLSPSQSFSASVSPSQVSPSPSPSSCYKASFDVSGATCVGCNGVFVVCDKRAGHLEFCLDGTFASSAVIQRRTEGDGWALYQFGKELYRVVDGPDGPQELPPTSDWRPSQVSMRPIKVERACTRIFTFVLEVDGGKGAEIDASVVAGPLAASMGQILHLSKGQVFVYKMEQDLVFFGVDLRLTPSIDGSGILDVLDQTVSDESLAIWLRYYGFDVPEGAKLRISDTMHAHKADRPEKLSPAQEHRLYPQVPVFDDNDNGKSQGAVGCVAGSVYCKDLKRCVDASVGCEKTVELSASMVLGSDNTDSVIFNNPTKAKRAARRRQGSASDRAAL